MKANLKGLGNVKGLLLAHGEKLGIAIVGICAVMFVYSSLSHEPLPDRYQASQLKSQIDQARRAVDEYTWTVALAEVPDAVRTAQPLKQGESITVQPGHYATSEFGWDRPVVPPTVLRKDPVLLAAEDVEVHSGSGLLAFEDPEIASRRRLQEEQAKQEREKEIEAQRNRDQDEGRARGRRGREPEDQLVDPKHPKWRRVPSGVDPAGVVLTGDERVETAYWAIVVAKVPIGKQLKLYRDVLANARDHDPQYDVPHYVGYIVERAEVRPGQPLKWEPLHVYDGQRKNLVNHNPAYPRRAVTGAALDKVVTEWAGASSQQEVVDERFFDPGSILPFPLPPLVGRDWDEDVTHPDIPLLWEDEGLDALQDELALEPREAPGAGDDTGIWAGVSDGRASGRSGRGLGSRGAPGDARIGRSGIVGRESAPDARASRMSRGRGGLGGGLSGGLLARDVSYWLLRFIDFSVEPGTKYKYRVRLALADVNNIYPNTPGRMVDKDALDSEVISRHNSGKGPKGVRLTEASEPSAVVGIPLAGDVRVAGARAQNDRLYNDEPRLSLLISTFGLNEENQAFQAAKIKEDVRRGNVANMTEDVEVLVEQGEYIDELDSFQFRTGITVVDIRGGEPLTRDLSTPAQALLMDPTGQLYVRRELKDFNEVQQHRLQFAKPEKGDRGNDPVRGRGPTGRAGR